MPLCQLQFCTNRRTHRPNETLLNFKEPYNTFHSLHVLLSLSQSKIVMLMAHCGQRPFVALFWEVAFKTGTFLFKSILPFWNSPKCMVGMGVLDQRLDLRILQVFFNLNDSMVLQLYDHWSSSFNLSCALPLDLYEGAILTSWTSPQLKAAHCYGENHFVFAQLCSLAHPPLPTLLMNSHHCREAGALCQHGAALSKTHQPRAIHGKSGKGFSGDCEFSKEN